MAHAATSPSIPQPSPAERALCVLAVTARGWRLAPPAAAPRQARGKAPLLRRAAVAARPGLAALMHSW